MQRKVVLAVVLVLLCGVSAYLWTTQTGTETDAGVAELKEVWHCSECSKQFELSVAEATAMLRTSRHEIVCPFCKQGGAERDSSTLMIMAGGVPTADVDGGEGDDEEEEEEEKPPEVGGSMGPVRP